MKTAREPHPIERSGDQGSRSPGAHIRLTRACALVCLYLAMPMVSTYHTFLISTGVPGGGVVTCERIPGNA